MKITDYINSTDGATLLMKYGSGATILCVLLNFCRAAWVARDHFPEGYAAVILLMLGAIFGVSVASSYAQQNPK